MSALDGFKPVDPAVVLDEGARGSRCPSRDLLEAFLSSDHDAVAKQMPEADLKRTAYNLRHYRKSHHEEFGNVGISARNGRLTLYRLE